MTIQTPPAKTKEELDATKIIAEAFAGAVSNMFGTQTGKTISKDAIKLTDISAKQLLESIAREIQFTGTFSKEDIKNFVDSYNKKANEQLDIVVRDVKSSAAAGATAEDIKTTISTKFPNFFDPKSFTRDFIWSKVNFADQVSLGAKALDALQTTRQIYKDFNTTASDVEIQATAKRIAKGEISADDLKTELSRVAALNYPQLAERFKNTPGATTRALVLPTLKIVADAWGVPIDTLDLSDPFIDSLIRPDGVVGKAAPKTPSEVFNAAMMHPNRDKSVAGNQDARNAATAFGKAMGFGV